MSTEIADRIFRPAKPTITDVLESLQTNTESLQEIVRIYEATIAEQAEKIEEQAATIMVQSGFMMEYKKQIAGLIRDVAFYKNAIDSEHNR